MEDATFRENALKSHIPGGTFGANIELGRRNLVDAIGNLGTDKAASLTIPNFVSLNS